MGMQNVGISTRIIIPYGSQPSSVVFECKTTPFGPAYKSLWVPDLTCRFVHGNSVPSIRILVSMGPRPYLSFCACKTATFGPAYKSLWVTDIPCHFVHAKRRD